MIKQRNTTEKQNYREKIANIERVRRISVWLPHVLMKTPASAVWVLIRFFRS